MCTTLSKSHDAVTGFTNKDIWNPASSSPTTLDLVTILHHRRRLILTLNTQGRITHDDFFSITGLLGNSSNSKSRIKTNKIAFISANAKRYPTQFLVPPKNVKRLPQDPGTWFIWSGGREANRSGLNSSASGPQISGDRWTHRIAGLVNCPATYRRWRQTHVRAMWSLW